MGTTSVSPGPATRCSPATVKCASPAVIMKRSSWWGCRCSVIDPPGTLRQLKRTTSSAPSCAVAVTLIYSPVAGLENSRNAAVAVSVGGMAQVFPLAWAEEPFWLRYQSTVAVIAVASGVPALPNVDSYLVVSSTKDSSNS